ncbi:outer membrane lipoprotein carrier protein LolA [Bacillus salitolerans]|uniref:Outer membrane lipoprotein carrier protein LolA n=1 Tax=Bacillus salitolerans TaxID=1437434 RepID=A0ABW4LS35_9BACI
MRKKLGVFLLAMLVVLALAGCGEKSQADVVKSLEAKMEEMSGYKANATMTLKTGSEEQVYEVEIWHSKPHYYRVNLKNTQKEQSQMILRNDEGVFVLTPALNKSFRFQSDWPQNSSQAYLYESLVKDILRDPEAVFTANDNHYVFETKTNYKNNKALPVQEITLNKSDLTPATVKVMDPDRNPLLQVDFTSIELNASFDEGAFDMQRNMTGAQMEVPTMASGSVEGPLQVLYPFDIPEGVALIGEKEMETENGKRVILTYGGEDKSFTLIQERARIADVATTSSVSGEPVDLGFTVGALSDSSVAWSHNGVDFLLASNNLTQEELLMVARSVQGQSIK